MFAKIRLRRKVERILYDEFGFEESREYRPTLEAVCDDAVARSLSAYDAAVVFMLQLLRESRAGDRAGASEDGIPFESHLANARIGTIARLIDARKVTPEIVDSWLGHSLREVRRVYA